jgi:BTB/POZ domain
MTAAVDWNVQFQAETSSGEKRSLYIHRFVLSARSEYYRTSSHPSLEVTDRSVSIQLYRGESNGVDVSGGGQGQTMMVQTLKAHEPFEVLHPILYFLYTDRVCFTTAPIEEATVIHQVPPCDAEQAYRIGDMLELPQLKSKALEFLVDTADATNIISRVFGEYALKYDEIGKAYEGVFYRCWNDLKKGEVLKQYFRDLREEDEAKKNDVTMRCLHIMQGLISSGQREE